MEEGKGMELIKTASYEEMSRVAADVLGRVLLGKPDCVLGLATGTTPLCLYKCLVEDY